MKRLPSALIAAVALMAGAAAPAVAQADDGRRAEAQLIAERSGVLPGETIYAALKLTLDEGWHVYWRNAGDAGLPPALIVGDSSDLPASALGAFLWPLPSLLPVVEGEIMDYGYDDEVVFAFPLTIPADASGELKLVAVADYLICESICIPETADVSLTLTAGAATENAAAGTEIAEWIARVPTDFAGEARVDDAGPTWTLSLRERGGFGRDARIRFFPYSHEINHSAGQPMRTGADGASLTLTPASQGKVDETLDGVVRIDRPGAEPVGFVISATKGSVLAGTADEVVAAADRPVAAPIKWSDLLVFAGLAFLGGLLLNLMPCVLPVLSMKAIGMVQAAATGKAGVLRAHGLWYTGGVLVAFAGLAVVILFVRAGAGAATLGFQLQHPPTVAILALVMFAIGLWLMGTFELGTSVQNIGGTLANRGGAAGAFFTGVLAAVVGAPCVGPFVGSAVGAVLGQPAPAVIGVLLAMGFGLAFPFLLLSFVPGLHKLMPKPGEWMETLKQAFAFPMFLTAAALVWVLGELAGSLAVAWTLAGATAIAFAVWLARGGGGVRRTASIAVLIAGFAYPAVQAATPVAVGEEGRPLASAYGSEAWRPERVAELVEEGRPVFVDFTAAWCATCQVNKNTTLKTRAVQEAFAAADVAFLVADFTRKDPIISAELKRLERAGVPVYLWYPPGVAEPRILPEILTPGLVIGLANDSVIKNPAD